MLNLSQQLIQSCFLNIGYSPLDYLYTNQIENAIDELNQQQFDKETLQQIINQCNSNSKGQIKLEDIILTLIKAENILIQRQFDLKGMINKLQASINDINHVVTSSPSQSNYQRMKLEQELGQVRQQLISNNINLQIIRKPFVNKKMFKQSRNQQPNQSIITYPQAAPSSQLAQNQELLIPSEGFTFFANTQTFTWIFQLTVLLLIISLPVMLYHNTFMNIIVFTLVLSNFFTGYFCRNLLRIWMYLILGSIVVDIIWFIIGAQFMWVASFKDWPHSINPYLRLSVVFYGVVCFGKLIVSIMLLSQYNTDESQKKRVSVFGFCQLELSHDEIKRNMFSILTKSSDRYHQDINQD